MNPVDLVAILLVLFAAVAGFRSGALPQLGAVAGAFAGAAVALTLLPATEDWIRDLDPVMRAFAVLATLLGAVGVGQAIGSGIGLWLGRRIGRGVLSAVDRLAGVGVGALQAVLIVWLAGGLLAVGPFPALARAAQTSTALRILEPVLPPPTLIAGEVGRLLDASGLPDVFLGFEPPAAPPVDRPTDERADRIAAAALASTPEISALACGNLQTGTGFVIADGYLVTNAHVVAGAESVRVGGDAGLVDGVVVLFDPELDVAVLRATGYRAPALRFATIAPERGTLGAAIGYPGGGSQAVVPVAVTGSYPAVGRDIYGEGRVTRQILELRAAIEQGDSGGPVILDDGSVGGVVFAESRTDPDVGYALTPTSVAIRVAPAVGRTGEVDVGPCIG